MEYEISSHAALLICSAVFAVLGIIFIVLTVVFRVSEVSVMQVLLHTKTFFSADSFKPPGRITRWLVLVCLIVAMVTGLLAMNEASKAMLLL